jgi:hypothetical protein
MLHLPAAVAHCLAFTTPLYLLPLLAHQVLPGAVTSRTLGGVRGNLHSLDHIQLHHLLMGRSLGQNFRAIICVVYEEGRLYIYTF